MSWHFWPFCYRRADSTHRQNQEVGFFVFVFFFSEMTCDTPWFKWALTEEHFIGHYGECSSDLNSDLWEICEPCCLHLQGGMAEEWSSWRGGMEAEKHQRVACVAAITDPFGNRRVSLTQELSYNPDSGKWTFHRKCLAASGPVCFLKTVPLRCATESEGLYFALMQCLGPRVPPKTVASMGFV